jgi:hypothetical protein
MAKDSKDSQETPHDAYVRVVLVHPGLLGAQVRAVLPKAVWKLLDLDQADAKAARFIDERLKAQESDAVFEISSASGDVQVFVLFEHQRTAPWHMPFRVLRYLTAFWHSKLAADPSARRLPLVIPLVGARGASSTCSTALRSWWPRSPPSFRTSGSSSTTSPSSMSRRCWRDRGLLERTSCGGP